MKAYSALPETDSGSSHHTRNKGSHIPPVSHYKKDEGSHIPPGSRRDLGQGGEWKQVSARGGRQAVSLPASSSWLPLHNRYDALELDSQNSNVDEEEMASSVTRVEVGC